MPSVNIIQAKNSMRVVSIPPTRSKVVNWTIEVIVLGEKGERWLGRALGGLSFWVFHGT